MKHGFHEMRSSLGPHTEPVLNWGCLPAPSHLTHTHTHIPHILTPSPHPDKMALTNSKKAHCGVHMRGAGVSWA